jgi:lipopolysaccharide/colanic/teichoic acid biosynthesis glycosyltransferase
MYRTFGKRFLDLVVAIPAMILLAPVLALMALLVRLDSPGPLFFTQDRLGRGGKVFRLYKMRTMTARPRVTDHEIIGRDPEVTRVGYWLRRFKLDELPQFISVLKGDMSVIGPRPGIPEQLSEYDENGRKRLLVRPGLTGLAQVNGNIQLSWPERWCYDAEYVDHLSFGQDLRILVRTFAVVILGEERFLKQPTTSCEGRS